MIFEICDRIDRQANIPTCRHNHHNTLHPCQGKVILTFMFGCHFREYPVEYAEKSEADEPLEGKYLLSKSSSLTCVSEIFTVV